MIFLGSAGKKGKMLSLKDHQDEGKATANAFSDSVIPLTKPRKHGILLADRKTQEGQVDPPSSRSPSW